MRSREVEKGGRQGIERERGEIMNGDKLENGGKKGGSEGRERKRDGRREGRVLGRESHKVGEEERREGVSD